MFYNKKYPNIEDTYHQRKTYIVRSMVSIRLTTFVFVLVFIMLQASAADIVLVTENLASLSAVEKGFTVRGGNPSAIGKDTVDAVTRRNGKTGGRKMMKRRVLMKEIEKDGGIMVNEEASKTYYCSCKGKRKLKTKCKLLCGRARSHDQQETSRRVDMTSFVALNADYHAPKSHPPKNN